MINKDDNEINFKRYSGDYLYSNYRKNVIEDNLYEDDEDDNYKSDELLNSVENEIIEDEKEIKQKKVVYYCPQYDDIKSNPNKIWMYYDERIKKTLKVMSYWKSFDIDDLYQQASTEMKANITSLKALQSELVSIGTQIVNIASQYQTNKETVAKMFSSMNE